MQHGKAFLALAAAVLVVGACEELPTDVRPDMAPAFAKRGAPAAFTAEHVVMFEDGVPGEFAVRVTALGGSVLRVHGSIGVAIVSGLTDGGAAELASAPDVAFAARDVMVAALPDPGSQLVQAGIGTAAHDPAGASLFGLQWDMHIIGVDDAWAAGHDDASGIRVAIIDTGIDPFHQDIAGTIDAASSIAFVPSVNGAGPPWGDDYFHGTHVAGTVTTNGIGTSGIAPHATLIAIKSCNQEGDCPFSAVISGLVHAADVDADIVNMSLGGFIQTTTPAGEELNEALNAAVNYANSKGVLVVSAAGNAAVDIDHIGRDFQLDGIRAVPCENGSGMCVSATGPTDLLASYSNYGRSAINVAAPGGDNALPGAAAAKLVLSPCSTLSVVPGLAACAGNGFYLFAAGTSMAAPHVAGAAALLDAQYDGRRNGSQLRSAIQKSADDLGRKGADAHYGRGRLNVARLLGVS